MPDARYLGAVPTSPDAAPGPVGAALHQWVRCYALLSLAILLTLVGGLTILYYQLPAFGLPGGQLDDLTAPFLTLASLIQLALRLGPTAFFALSTLAYSAARPQRQRAPLFASSADSNLDLYIEPIIRNTSE